MKEIHLSQGTFNYGPLWKLSNIISLEQTKSKMFQASYDNLSSASVKANRINTKQKKLTCTQNIVFNKI